MNNKPKSIFRDIYYHPYKSKFFKLSQNAKDDGDLIQRLGLLKTLDVHQGCVNTICWNSTGEYLLSGSDDQHLVVTNGHTYEVKANHCTSHHANIFSAKFLPCSSDRQIVSCSGDGLILHTDLENTKETYYNQFNCHVGTTYEVITIPNDPHTFLSCGEDGTVRWFDLRTKTSCQKTRCKDDILISCPKAITALAISPTTPHQLAVGCANSAVRIYDRRCLSTNPEEHLKAQPFCNFVAPHMEERRYRITSLSYSPDGQDMLVSYSSDYLYLFRVQENAVVPLKKSPRISPWEKVKMLAGKRDRLNHSPPPVRRLRLRGDWSDTGPDARPERDTTTTVSIGQARPQLHATLMQRMTDVLSQMLNDPMTRAALSAGGEDSLDPDESARNIANRQQEEQGESPQPSPYLALEQNPVPGGPAPLPTPPPPPPPPPENQTASTSDHMDVDPVASTSQSAQQEQLQEQSQLQPSEATPGPSSGEPQPQSGEGSACVNSLYGHLNTLRNLRDGFIEQHGSEPSVSLRYSQQSTANATISLSMGDELRGCEVPAASSTSSVPSTSRNEQPQPATTSQEDSISDVEFDFDDEFSEPAFQKTDYNISTFEAEMKQKYVGHRNARTMIKEASFWGNDYVMSGSDCGHVFIWDKNTAKLKMLLQADQHVVNCLQPHPTLPLLATSGIDHDIKLWAPILEEANYDSRMADILIHRNAIMLEETKDTITVPAAFMIRMLACLNQIRRGTRTHRPRRHEEEDEENC